MKRRAAKTDHARQTLVGAVLLPVADQRNVRAVASDSAQARKLGRAASPGDGGRCDVIGYTTARAGDGYGERNFNPLGVVTSPRQSIKCVVRTIPGGRADLPRPSYQSAMIGAGVMQMRIVAFQCHQKYLFGLSFLYVPALPSLV